MTSRDELNMALDDPNSPSIEMVISRETHFDDKPNNDEITKCADVRLVNSIETKTYGLLEEIEEELPNPSSQPVTTETLSFSLTSKVFKNKNSSVPYREKSQSNRIFTIVKSDIPDQVKCEDISVTPNMYYVVGSDPPIPNYVDTLVRLIVEAALPQAILDMYKKDLERSNSITQRIPGYESPTDVKSHARFLELEIDNILTSNRLDKKSSRSESHLDSSGGSNVSSGLSSDDSRVDNFNIAKTIKPPKITRRRCRKLSVDASIQTDFSMPKTFSAYNLSKQELELVGYIREKRENEVNKSQKNFFLSTVSELEKEISALTNEMIKIDTCGHEKIVTRDDKLDMNMSVEPSVQMANQNRHVCLTQSPVISEQHLENKLETIKTKKLKVRDDFNETELSTLSNIRYDVYKQPLTHHQPINHLDHCKYERQSPIKGIMVSDDNFNQTELSALSNIHYGVYKQPVTHHQPINHLDHYKYERQSPIKGIMGSETKPNRLESPVVEAIDSSSSCFPPSPLIVLEDKTMAKPVCRVKYAELELEDQIRTRPVINNDRQYISDEGRRRKMHASRKAHESLAFISATKWRSDQTIINSPRYGDDPKRMSTTSYSSFMLYKTDDKENVTSLDDNVKGIASGPVLTSIENREYLSKPFTPNYGNNHVSHGEVKEAVINRNSQPVNNFNKERFPVIKMTTSQQQIASPSLDETKYTRSDGPKPESRTYIKTNPHKLPVRILNSYEEKRMMEAIPDKSNRVKLANFYLKSTGSKTNEPTNDNGSRMFNKVAPPSSKSWIPWNHLFKNSRKMTNDKADNIFDTNAKDIADSYKKSELENFKNLNGNPLYAEPNNTSYVDANENCYGGNHQARGDFGKISNGNIGRIMSDSENFGGREYGKSSKSDDHRFKNKNAKFDMTQSVYDVWPYEPNNDPLLVPNGMGSNNIMSKSFNDEYIQTWNPPALNNLRSSCDDILGGNGSHSLLESSRPYYLNKYYNCNGHLDNKHPEPYKNTVLSGDFNLDNEMNVLNIIPPDVKEQIDMSQRVTKGLMSPTSHDKKNKATQFFMKNAEKVNIENNNNGVEAEISDDSYRKKIDYFNAYQRQLNGRSNTAVTNFSGQAQALSENLSNHGTDYNARSDICTHDKISPEVCKSIANDLMKGIKDSQYNNRGTNRVTNGYANEGNGQGLQLNGHSRMGKVDRGAEIFAKRRLKSQDWVVNSDITKSDCINYASRNMPSECNGKESPVKKSWMLQNNHNADTAYTNGESRVNGVSTGYNGYNHVTPHREKSNGWAFLNPSSSGHKYNNYTKNFNTLPKTWNTVKGRNEIGNGGYEIKDIYLQ
ncbi:uncharacterized protein LOC135927296 [Gordionus sp. m RMFG-2023]|uniref:uncharacterized protein LOC135927296 n=1 Tax=Gordionus sp. m RMFG-2023 TaxID=3053472 RepID=UPI0031FCA019